MIFISQYSVFLWVAAFVCALMPLAAYEAESFLLCFVLLTLAVLTSLGGYVFKPQILMIPKSPLVWIAGAFWFLALVSVILSAAPYISFLYFCFFSVFPLTVILMLLQSDLQKFFKYAGSGLAVIYAALALTSLAQYAFSPDMLYKGLTHWPLANPNSLGALYGMGVFGALGWMLAAPNRGQSNTALALAILIFAALLTTGCRGALAALLLALPVFIFSLRLQAVRHKRCLAIFTVAAIALFFMIGHLAAVPGKDMASITMRSAAGEMPLLWSRPAIWASTWEMIQDHFWTGTGIGTFFLNYPEYRGADFRTAGLMAHSDPLQFWAEMGVLAPLLFYGFIAGATIRTVRAIHAVTAGDIRRVYIMAAFFALGALVAHSHVSFNFNVLPLLMSAGFLLGFWFDQTASVLKDRRSKQPQKPVLIIVSIVLLIAASAFVLLQSSYILTGRAATDIAEGRVERFAAKVNRADKISFGRNDRAYIFAANFPLAQLQSGLAQGRAAQTLYEQGYAFLEKAAALNPRQADVLYNKAQLERAAQKAGAVTGPQSPENFLHQAVKLNPLHVRARRMLAEIYAEKGEASKALDLLEEGLRWPYNDREALPYLQYTAALSLREGRMDLHKLALQKMLQIEKANRAALAKKTVLQTR